MSSRGPRTQETHYKGSCNYFHFMLLRMLQQRDSKCTFTSCIWGWWNLTLFFNLRQFFPLDCPTPIPWPVFLGLLHRRLISPTFSCNTLLSDDISSMVLPGPPQSSALASHITHNSANKTIYTSPHWTPEWKSHHRDAHLHPGPQHRAQRKCSEKGTNE